MGGVVPLSEHEQRQLEQIEQALYREDPKFGRLVRSSDPRVHYKRKLAQAVIGIAVGAGLLAAGVVTHRVYLEAAGAAVALLALVWAVGQLAAAPGQGQARAGQGKPEGRQGPGAAWTRRPRRPRPRGADQAGPDDGADGRAVAAPAGGRQDVAARAASPAGQAAPPPTPSPRAAPEPQRRDPVWNPRGRFAEGGHHRGGEDGRAPSG
jgi:Protein of unknown function (DUF3040).